MKELFEAGMVICFGVSWPLSIMKSWRARTSKGKSLIFLLFIWAGYICGIISKLLADNITYVFVFYVINLVMVSCDVILYFRNYRLDQVAASGKNADSSSGK
ncbi:MAG: hypothetical protein ACOX4M_01935 [Acetivibrionales bacterium]|jgi:hypothetical protein